MLQTRFAKVTGRRPWVRAERSLSAVDEDVHLLADVNGKFWILESENHLQYAGIDALCAFAGEGFFWEDVGIDTYKLEGDSFFARPLQKSHGRAARTNSGGIGFIDIHAQLELRNVTQQNGCLG